MTNVYQCSKVDFLFCLFLLQEQLHLTLYFVQSDIEKRTSEGEEDPLETLAVEETVRATRYCRNVNRSTVRNSLPEPHRRDEL